MRLLPPLSLLGSLPYPGRCLFLLRGKYVDDEDDEDEDEQTSGMDSLLIVDR